MNPGGAVNSGIFVEHETDMRNRIVYIFPIRIRRFVQLLEGVLKYY